jgi:hypothetical protein
MKKCFVNKEIAAIKQQIAQHIDSHPDLRGKRDLLVSISGITETSAAAILVGHMQHMAELGDVTLFMRARQVAAFASLVPKIRHSRSSVRGRATLPKRGESRDCSGVFSIAVYGSFASWKRSVAIVYGMISGNVCRRWVYQGSRVMWALPLKTVVFSWKRCCTVFVLVLHGVIYRRALATGIVCMSALTDGARGACGSESLSS